MDISIRSTSVLSTLGAIALGILLLAENSKSFQREIYYEEKLAAATKTQQAMSFLKEQYFPNEIAIDNINDPNHTGLIGHQFSPITSGRGSLPNKLSTTNPNFAAMIVQQIKEAGLKKGDRVGMCFTGSFPALNIAACVAVESLGLEPILISSVTSSSWGANDPMLTWLDMQHSLCDAGLINFMPVAASIGGNQDLGRTLSKAGRQLALEAIDRNNIPRINEGSLKANIQKRMALFDQYAKQPIQLFINVGGGIASLGGHQNAQQLPSGLIPQYGLNRFVEKRGVMFEMAKMDTPVINLLKIHRLMSQYQLPRNPVPLPEVGEGPLFMAYKYNLSVVLGLTALFFSLIATTLYYDAKQNKLGTQILKTN
ncbi:MAG: poly-gamma-glutamate system protein [Bacteroidota bacterium]